MGRVAIGDQRKAELQDRIHEAVARIRAAPDEQHAGLHMSSLLADLLDEVASTEINRDLPDPRQSHLSASDLTAQNYVDAIHEWRRILDEPAAPSFGNTFVHVTYEENLDTIQSDGLKPSRGARVQAMDDEEGVYLFTDLETAEDAVMNWLGDELDDEKDLVFLEITVSDEDKANLKRSDAGFEVIYQGTVPPSVIEVLSIEPADTLRP